MRSIWNGTIRFGLVAIPVGLVPARAGREESFRSLHRACLAPVRKVSYCAQEERVVASEELVRGFEIVPGQFVTLEDAELEALAPADSRSLEIQCLLDLERIDVARVERTYYLSASQTSIGRRPYVLLHRVLVEREQVAIARLVYRRSEWVVAIGAHPARSLLVLQKLAFDEELVDPLPLEVALRDAELQERELELGRELAQKLSRKKPAARAFRSEERARVRQVVEGKVAGGTIVTPKREQTSMAPDVPVVDLADALRRSIRKRPAKAAKVASRPPQLA